MRIVSLLPSATEIAFAIGAGDDVVGVTFECDAPAEARTRTIVTSSNLPQGLTPAEIDAVVSQRMAAGEDLYRLDEGALAELDPTVVLTQDLCAVCAVDLDDTRAALDHLGCRAEVITLDPHDIEGILATITQVGNAVGHGAEAEALVAALRRRLDAVTAQVAGTTPVDTLLLEWIDPPFAPGHWIPEMISTAGGRSVLGSPTEPSRQIAQSDVDTSGASIVVVAPCGYGLDDAVAQANDLVDSGRVPDGAQVWAVNADAAFARPGPRVVDGTEALAAILHPQRCGTPDPTMARQVR